MLNGRFLASRFAQLLRGMARNDNFIDTTEWLVTAVSDTNKLDDTRQHVELQRPRSIILQQYETRAPMLVV
ncbi:hypothetical protein A2215_03465 [Candidatus Berkelbacteria bacterium RIFOXYA2_FULL_43_10]|uniref:Uncharacterized protein n=1 Tax=Candidatus Berkelbacteria bacterium RIFOXYA2_FULL_43_10 TaxID=1797472 RepID=A0A1F5EFK6_9BACT|nr:MAG: hypothetical protein A2215_03465 [Candidatus Berkelbacteria bacterium RIFOXYA2_FULL_43_10]